MSSFWEIYSNPIVVLTLLIIIGVTLLIGAAVLGLDRGVLASMGRVEYARGLITYLFALATVGMAVSLLIYAMTDRSFAGANDVRFQYGKEILSLLLGLFGTIVGFYFGSESAKGAREDTQTLQVSSVDVTPQPLGPAGLLTVRAVARGGVPPYRFGIALGNEPVETKDIAFEGGWIVKQLQLSAPQQGETQVVHLVVEDAARNRTDRIAAVRRSAQD